MDKKHEIYCFNNGGSSQFLFALALADDGHVVAEHLCSNEFYMAHDLGITSDWKHEEYNKHFGEGNWTLIWIDDPVNDERVKSAMVLNEKLREEAEKAQGVKA